MASAYETYNKLAAEVAAESRSGKIDPGKMQAKADAFNAYRQEQRKAAARGEIIVNGEVDEKRSAKARPKASLQDEYIHKLDNEAKDESGKTPRQLAKERLNKK